MDELKPLSDFVIGAIWDAVIVGVVAAVIIGATIVVATVLGVQMS